jgi:lysozyme family protein
MEGVTLATFRRYEPGATIDDLKHISDAEVLRIYRDGYWAPVGGDALPAGVDLAAFDYGVNSGVGAAKKALTASLGLAPAPRVKAICGRRGSILHGLRTWRFFGKGWGARVAQIEALGVKWALASSGVAPAAIPPALKKEASAASASSDKAGASAAAHGTVTGSVATVHASSGGSHSTIIVLAVVAVLGVAILAFIAWRQSQRAAAFSAVAKES